ncbi:Glu/Leu/Phe/Val dehydrogenase dimerization domain-containing protein [Sphingomonas hankookensis]|uniref:Glu/Leu/Phe/Val dehydrogenase dimerization domain-containing protein n=1 Tax=Sphingomonas hankookensis TaxID=563996 RepID=UPI003D303406
MQTDWGYPDFDDHEGIHLFSDHQTGLRCVIAVHSTALGPAAGGVRFWRYATSDAAVTDALRLSRGMSFKNAMAGLPMGVARAWCWHPMVAPRPPNCSAHSAARSNRSVVAM